MALIQFYCIHVVPGQQQVLFNLLTVRTVMEKLYIVIAGVGSTIVFSFFMKICALFIKDNIAPIRILSQMIAGVLGRQFEPGWITRIAAVLIYLSTGILYSLLYYFLYHSRGYLARTTIPELLVLGIIYGLAGVGSWIIFWRLHPSPPETIPWPAFLVCVFAGHIVYTAVLTTLYSRFF